MRSITLYLLFVLFFIVESVLPESSPARTSIIKENEAMTITVKKSQNFKVTGDGIASMWRDTEWFSLPQRKGKDTGLKTELKILYSDSGLYFLFYCEDRRLTANIHDDFKDLWKEDVVEVFLWPDEHYPIYFEYELSPLNHELVLLVPNFEGKLWGWRPWHYEGNRLVQHATTVQGGKMESNAAITAWMAEFYIPYTLLMPLQNVPPKSDTKWRANFYRCDYDQGEMAYWAWQPVEKRFHEFQKFGTLIFE